MSILRFVTDLDIAIVKVTISFCSINRSLRSIFGEELNMNLSRELGSIVKTLWVQIFKTLHRYALCVKMVQVFILTMINVSVKIPKV